MAFRAQWREASEVQSRRDNRASLASLTAWDRHKLYVRQAQEHYGAAAPDAAPGAATRTDADALREQHRFIRDATHDAADASWEVRLACKYYAKLVKEYGICDLSAYRDSRVGLRWRTEREVVTGKGQFACGARGCTEQSGLATFELPFSYREAGEAKQALVKVRVCAGCAVKLNWRKERKLRKLEKALHKHAGKRLLEGGANSSSGNAKRARLLDDGGESTLPAASAPPEEPLMTVPPAGKASEAQATDAGASDGRFWAQKEAAQEASIEDEFDQYFEGMFL